MAKVNLPSLERKVFNLGWHFLLTSSDPQSFLCSVKTLFQLLKPLSSGLNPQHKWKMMGASLVDAQRLLRAPYPTSEAHPQM